MYSHPFPQKSRFFLGEGRLYVGYKNQNHDVVYHDSVYNTIEKHCGHNAALTDTSLDFKRDVTITKVKEDSIGL